MKGLPQATFFSLEEAGIVRNVLLLRSMFLKGLPQATFFSLGEAGIVRNVLLLRSMFLKAFCICIGLPGLFHCWQGVIKNSNRPPVVISVVLTKSKNQL